MVDGGVTLHSEFFAAGLLGPTTEPDDDAAWPGGQKAGTGGHEGSGKKASVEAYANSAVSPPSGHTLKLRTHSFDISAYLLIISEIK